MEHLKPEDKHTLDGQLDIRKALIEERQFLLIQLREKECAITKLKDEAKPIQDALQHIDALLNLDGWNKPTETGSEDRNELENPQDNKELIGSVLHLLEKKGKPMHYREIYEKLRDQGVYVPGKDPAATLLARISRDIRLKRVKARGTYALASWRIRAAKPRSKARKKATQNKRVPTHGNTHIQDRSNP